MENRVCIIGISSQHEIRIELNFNIFPLNIQFWASYYRNIMQFHVDLNVHTTMLIIPERSIISLS